MKKSIPIIVIFCMISIINTYGNTDRWLSMKASTVNTENNKWTFSSIYPSESCPFYRLYGDSLITEVWLEDRQWYAINSDSILYLGEETRFHNAFTKIPIPTSAFGNIWLANEVLSNTGGHYYHTFELGHDGSYECSLPVEGEIVVEDGNIIPAVAITETRKFVFHIGNGSLPTISLVSKQISRTRWFIDGDILPVAMQITEKRLIQKKEISSETYTYLIDFSKLPIKENSTSRMRIQQALDDAEITHDNELIRINGYFPPNISLKLYISNVQGSFFHLEPIEVRVDEKLTEIHLPYLPSGQYIATISAGTSIDRKIIINF